MISGCSGTRARLLYSASKSSGGRPQTSSSASASLGMRTGRSRKAGTWSEKPTAREASSGASAARGREGEPARTGCSDCGPTVGVRGVPLRLTARLPDARRVRRAGDPCRRAARRRATGLRRRRGGRAGDCVPRHRRARLRRNGAPAAPGQHRSVGLFGPLDRLAGQLLDRLDVFRLGARDDRLSEARAAGAAGAADAVDVVLRMGRHVEIEDVADGRDIEPARRDVARHQQLELPVAKAVERLQPRMLVHVAVQRADRIAVALERAVERRHVALAVAEDDGVGEVGAPRR